MFKERVIGKTPSPKHKYWATESDQYFQKSSEKKKIHFEDLAEEKYGNSLTFRAEQIAFWLTFHKIEDCDFIIFDDVDADSEGLRHFENRFIRVHMLSNLGVDSALNAIF